MAAAKKNKRKQSFGLASEDTMTNDALLEYKALYHALDISKKGELTRSGLKDALSAFGFRKSEAEIDEMWADSGAALDQPLSFTQFVGMIDSHMHGYITKASLAEAFQCVEANAGRAELVGGGAGPNDVVGKLNADEFEAMLKEGGARLTPGEVDEFFTALRVDANGQIRVEDIVKLLVE
eukprot:a676644_825.p1 GENE.a676644_825~~a676644_825.p1  ORF type:complete len:195 (-),score=87.16 a676644_825:134-673(-)